MPEKEITVEQKRAIEAWIVEKNPQGKTRGWLAEFGGVGRLLVEKYIIGSDDHNYLKLLEDRTQLGLRRHPVRQTDQIFGPLKVSCSDVVAGQLKEAGLVEFPKPLATE